MLLSATIEIASVQSSADMLRFIEFPYEHYREDPNWLAPLRLDQREILDITKHSFYKPAETECFLARSNGCVCGRIAAIMDRDYNAGRDPKVGTFGFYESTD